MASYKKHDSYQLVASAELERAGREKDKLVKNNVDDDDQMRRTAIIVSVISIIVTFILGVTAFVLGILEGSVATFGFACGAVLDSLSSAVVAWRYCGNVASLYAWERERKACIALGCLFVGIFFVITGKSVLALVTMETPNIENRILWYVSLVNGISCTILAVVKFWLGSKLKSSAVKTDAFNSLIDSVLAYCTLVSTAVYRNDRTIWYLDAVVGIGCSVFILCYGIKLLYEYLPHKAPEDVQEAGNP